MTALERISKLASATALLAITASLGCGQDGEATEPIEAKKSALVKSGNLWPASGATLVRVCWETGLANGGSGNEVNPHNRADWPILSATVRDAMHSSWGRVANIQFIYFEDCPSNSSAGNGGYLAINMGGGNNATGGNTLLGYQGPSAWTRMRLDPDTRSDESLDYWARFSRSGHP